MKLTEKLSPHFTLGEMITTSHRHIDNMPTPEEIERLTRLCLEFMEPVRERFGPIRVTSGFRCVNLNSAIGGSKASAHIYGCAADFVTYAATRSSLLFSWNATHKRARFCNLNVSFGSWPDNMRKAVTLRQPLHS